MYKDTFIAKEMKQTYIDRLSSNRSQLGIALFTALLSFSLHFVLQSLQRSVFIDALPHLMQKSHFSTLSIYIVIIQLFYVFYFMVHYEHLTFAEITHNRWYVLIKNGANARNMIFSKLTFRLINIIFVYTLGYIITFVLSLFLKYPIVIEYLVPLYLAGFMNLLFIISLTMITSLFFKYSKDVRYILLFILLLIWGINNVFDFSTVITSRTIMSKGLVALSPTTTMYPTFLMIILLCSVILVYFKAKKLSRYMDYEFFKNDLDYPDNVEIIISKDGNLDRFKKLKLRKYDRIKISDIMINTILSIFILMTISFNILILLVSLASPEREIDVVGYIPYVFQSETMEDTIIYNDLAFFHVIDEQYTISKDDIVLYKDTLNEVTVARVLDQTNAQLEVDIDNYPESDTGGSMRETIEFDQVYGVYCGRSRWLGALILFGNTPIGRISMLLIPVILIFYYRQITDIIKKSK